MASIKSELLGTAPAGTKELAIENVPGQLTQPLKPASDCKALEHKSHVTGEGPWRKYGEDR